MDYDKTCEIALKEMFKRVGEEYPNPKLTNQKEWYMKRSWTEKEEDGFRQWLVALIKKRHKYLTKRRVDLEVAMFLLMWGWTNKRGKK